MAQDDGKARATPMSVTGSHFEGDHEDHCPTCNCWGYIDNPAYDGTDHAVFPLQSCPEKDCPHKEMM